MKNYWDSFSSKIISDVMYVRTFHFGGYNYNPNNPPFDIIPNKGSINERMIVAIILWQFSVTL